MAQKADQLMSWSKRIGIAFVGNAAKFAESKLFDEFVYGFVNIWAITEFGIQLGASLTFLIMAPSSALFCLWYLHLYDRTEKDLFGFEAIKVIRDIEAITNRWRRFLCWLIRLGDIPAFIVLNCFWPNGDPFMATVYLRKEENVYRGLTRRDKDIFWASVLLSNSYWTLRWTGLVVFYKELIWPVTRHWFA
jgi:hypothetical protein